MHLCSALCATGSDGCCGKEDNDNHHDKKTSGSHEEKSDGKDKDCQDMHFAYFNVTGQFAQAKADISFKAFQPLVAVVTPLFIIQPVEATQNSFAYNTFHPPPLKVDLRILIQSFQI